MERRPVIMSDPKRTEARLRELGAYMEANVLGPGGFCCDRADECRDSIKAGHRFYEGILSHVGRHFDLTWDGRPVRVVVVGQESGHRPNPLFKSEHVTLEERHRMVHERSGLGRRYYATHPYPARNPHMRGTTSALRVLFGKGLGADWEGEFLLTADQFGFHIFDAFALVNVLLCSAHPPGSGAGSSTKLMRRNCLPHLEATVRILEPTVLILQGRGVQAWLRPVIQADAPVPGQPHLSRLTIADQEMLAARFSHPAARGASRWGDSLDAPYVVRVVEPTLRALAADL